MNIAVRRYLKRSRLAQAMVEDWRVQHVQAMIAQDVEEFAQECIELAALTKRAWSLMLPSLFDNEHCNDSQLDELGEIMKNALAKTRVVFDAVQTSIVQAQSQGYAIANADEMQQALGDLHKIEEKVNKIFPTFDYEMIEKHRQAFLQGDFVTAEDLLREAQNCTTGSN